MKHQDMQIKMALIRYADQQMHDLVLPCDQTLRVEGLIEEYQLVGGPRLFHITPKGLDYLSTMHTVSGEAITGLQYDAHRRQFEVIDQYFPDGTPMQWDPSGIHSHDRKHDLVQRRHPATSIGE